MPSPTLMPSPRQRFYTNLGTPAAFHKLYTYAAGTTNQKVCYQDAAGTVAHENPITLDAKGEALIYFLGNYKIDLKDPLGLQITGYPVDNFESVSSQIATAVDSSAGMLGVSLDALASALQLADYAALRAYAGTRNNVYVVGSGIVGMFVRDDSDTTSADNGGTVIVAANGKRWRRAEAPGMFNPAWFGAKFDGVTNDSDAFQACSAALMAAGGGTYWLPPGKTAIVGEQLFANGAGKGYAYKGTDIINIRNCTKPVIIEGNGCILRNPAGMKFGAFDPTTGAAYTPASLPFTDLNYAADIGSMLTIVGNTSKVVVRNLELDGNSGAIMLGGAWGDSGRQRIAYGLYSSGNEALRVDDLYSHHHGTDGVLLAWPGAVESDRERPVLLVNVRSEYNSRQALSWVGGIGLYAMNSQFNHTGKGAFVTSPAAGIDIEAESSVCRKGLFINCEAGNNAGQALVADSGDSADMQFTDCRFYGTTQAALWTKKPRFSFDLCMIAGGAVNAFTAANERDRTKFTRCTFSADEVFQGIAATGSSYLADFTSQNPVFDDTDFITNNANVRLQASSASALYRNCRMVQNGSTAAALPRGTFEGFNSIAMTTGSADLTGSVFNGRLKTSGTIAGAIVASGQVPSASAPSTYRLAGVGSNGAVYLETGIGFGYQAPTAGAWVRGDRMLNNNPAVGAAKGWICTVSGTPGTWVSEGVL